MRADLRLTFAVTVLAVLPDLAVILYMFTTGQSQARPEPLHLQAHDALKGTRRMDLISPDLATPVLHH